MQVVCCLVLPALVCATLYAALRPASFSLVVAGAAAALYASLVTALRTAFLEQQYKVHLPAVKTPCATPHIIRHSHFIFALLSV